MTTAIKLKKATFKHIEAELYCYHDTLKEIDRLRKDIMFCREEVDENVGGGRSNLPSSPTERIGTILLTHKKLQQLETIANAIQLVFDRVPDEYKRLIQLKYWTKPQRYTWDGIADQLHISKRQAMRWRDEIIYAIAEVLGWR
ncbi:phage transcriptional regulator, RinA family protein [Parageobacillus genomosp. 1]|uniref:Phage transcriptional regulator, RinA family protein n=1 Tax=Parageobacillus genomosp. 1 TaxID=1295642 RepID=A0ABC9VGH8_9BACL|nr:RinA family phage transcriptional regulator [Parageobacillus genomosp. 1]EZP77606.1 phage transcriptional regulator, RinA family protein [Parageobacillus genomosp. 1]